MRVTAGGLLLLTTIIYVDTGVVSTEMMADLPVTFPERGALPNRFPPDRSGAGWEASAMHPSCPAMVAVYIDLWRAS